MKIIDYYALFAVSPSASLRDIRKSYRNLAFRYHPDINKNLDAIRTMQLLNEAYSVLGNPIRRARYDYLRKYAEQISSNPEDLHVHEQALSYHRIGSKQTIIPPNISESLFTKTALFVGQVFYRLVYDLTLGFISTLPYVVLFLLYFFLFGSFMAWINPKIFGMSSDETLVVTNANAFVLSLITMRQLQRKGILTKFFQVTMDR
jgi:curved DNA-binding protein CbpA